MGLEQVETGALMRKLAKSASWWRRFVSSTDDEEIHEIVSALSPVELAILDQRVRGMSEYSYAHYNLRYWQDLRPWDVWCLARSKYALSLLGLASFHYSGYVREAAVNKLAALRTGKELPFLLVRLNDWVAEVRNKAERAVQKRITPEYATHFIVNLPLLLRLKYCGRLNRRLIENVQALLRKPECKSALEAGMASDDKAIRRMSFQLAVEAEPSARLSIVSAWMKDKDVCGRAWAVRMFLPEVAAEELPGVVEPMLNDRFMPVRRDALWELATKRPDVAVEAIRCALLDKHVGMRETAYQFVAQAGVADVRTFYIEAVQRGNESELVGAICGLGECGQASDVALISEYLRSTQIKFRRAAVYAVGKLDADSYLERFMEALLDVKASVSREALKILLPKANRIPLEDLEAIVASDVEFHVRRNALLLILRAGKWRKLPALLNACADGDEKIAELAKRQLHDWFYHYNGSFAEPTREDVRRIESVLAKMEDKLPKKEVQEVRTCLKIYFK